MENAAPASPAPSAFVDEIVTRLECRLRREVEAFESRPVTRESTALAANLGLAKRLIDAARSLMALKTAVLRLAQLGARPERARTPGSAAALPPVPADAPAPLATNRAERRRAERLLARLPRALDRAAA